MTGPGDFLDRLTSAVEEGIRKVAGRTASAAAFGVVLVLLAAVVVGGVVMSFTGSFTRYVAADAVLPPGSPAVALGSQVEYDNVQVGTVAGQAAPNAAGQVVVPIHLSPNEAPDIPDDVQASVQPVSIFGNEHVVLVPPAAPGPQGLHAGQVIPALPAAKAAGVQTTVSTLDDLLKESRPADLAASLNAIADALQGRGASLGRTTVQFNTYLQQLQPLWPEIVADANLLIPVAGTIADSSPNILTTIANFSSTSGVLVSQQGALDSVLSGGLEFTGLASGLLSEIQDPYNHLVSAAGPFLQDAAQTPTTVAELFSGLDAWAKSWTSAAGSGPYLVVSSPVVVSNPADLALAALSGSNTAQLLASAIGSTEVNPATYSAADCPRYGALAGANCNGVSASAAVASGRSVSGAAAEAAATQVAASVSGGRVPASPAAATLLLEPVLSSMAAGR